MTVIRVRGFPLLQLLIVLVVFAAAGVPVWSLTRSPVAAASPPVNPKMAPTPPAPDTETPLFLEADFAPAPLDFEVRCQDQVVLEGHGPGRQFSTTWKTAPLPKEGIDFVVRAHWPAEPGAATGPAAARFSVRLPGGSTVERSFWTAPGKALAEVVTVGASPAVPEAAP